ncbi:hypothetical protein ACFLZ1_03670 [Patescibacteria group bacterium]
MFEEFQEVPNSSILNVAIKADPGGGSMEEGHLISRHSATQAVANTVHNGLGI